MGYDRSLFVPGSFDLSDSKPGIYDPSVPIEKLLEEDGRLISDFEATMSVVTACPTPVSIGLFKQVLLAYNNLLEGAKNIEEDALCYQAQDSVSERQKALSGATEKLVAQMRSSATAFETWLQGLDSGIAQEYLSSAGECRYALSRLLANKQYALADPNEEKGLVARESETRSSNSRVVREIVTDLRADVEIDGIRPHNLGTLAPRFKHSDPTIRRAVYNALFPMLASKRQAIFDTYVPIVRSWNDEYVVKRGMPSPIHQRNILNDLPDETIELLLHVAREENEIFRRFWNLKAKMMLPELLLDGKLQRYDIYAPTTDKGATISLEDGTLFVLEKIAEMDPKLAEMVYSLFKIRHIDRGIRPNKQNGAFCSEQHRPGILPYILYPYNEQKSDLSTLFHEFGHGVADMLSMHLRFLAFHPATTMAEIPSTFIETYGWDMIRNITDDPEVKRSMLAVEIGDTWASVMRQAYFTLFEIEAHKAVLQGASAEDLSQIHLTLLNEQFGDSVAVPEMFKDEWLYVSHFWNYPFYVPAYSFGNLMALALYQRYTEDPSFLKDILAVWAKGNSVKGVDALRSIGVDPLREETFRDGFRALERKVDTLEAMLNQR